MKSKLLIILLLFISFSAFYIHKVHESRYANRPWQVSGLTESVTLPLSYGKNVKFDFTYSVRDKDCLISNYWLLEGVVSAFYEARQVTSPELNNVAFLDSINAYLPKYRLKSNPSEIRIDKITGIEIYEIQ